MNQMRVVFKNSSNSTSVGGVPVPPGGSARVGLLLGWRPFFFFARQKVADSCLQGFSKSYQYNPSGFPQATFVVCQGRARNIGFFGQFFLAKAQLLAELFYAIPYANFI